MICVLLSRKVWDKFARFTRRDRLLDEDYNTVTQVETDASKTAVDEKLHKNLTESNYSDYYYTSYASRTL